LGEVAQNVGEAKRNNCGACHFNGGGGNGVKHGDLDTSLIDPPKSLDVHMSKEGENMDCADCHKTEGHNTAGSRYDMIAKDTHGKDLPKSDGEPTSCESCHGLAPHEKAKLNDHVDRVACQTCHIPTFARGGNPTLVWWDWSLAGDKKRGVEEDAFGKHSYDFKKGEMTWAKDIVPTYKWFNGQTDYVHIGEQVETDGKVILNALGGSPDDPNARIYPFKVVNGKQGYDPETKQLLVPHLFPSNKEDKTAYWKGYDWDAAFKAGMDAVNQPFSGQYEWVDTEMYWPITHMVAPGDEALQCGDCHSPNGRMTQVAGVYVPGQDRFPWVDTLGWLLAGLSLLGVIIHAFLRYRSSKQHGA
jgi:octaheme c-type cytochrome (tetrathionate reductase family)